MDKIGKWVDVPPVWLLGTLMLSRWVGQYLDFGLTFGGTWARWAAVALALAGLALAVLAILEMRKKRTTVIPHREAKALVTSGVFAVSRNPIYVGDLLILLGGVLWWDAVLALALVPLLLKVLEGRFIRPEEDRLRSKFVAEYTRYSQQTRRWL